MDILEFFPIPYQRLLCRNNASQEMKRIHHLMKSIESIYLDSALPNTCRGSTHSLNYLFHLDWGLHSHSMGSLPSFQSFQSEARAIMHVHIKLSKRFFKVIVLICIRHHHVHQEKNKPPGKLSSPFHMFWTKKSSGKTFSFSFFTSKKKYSGKS